MHNLPDGHIPFCAKKKIPPLGWDFFDFNLRLQYHLDPSGGPVVGVNRDIHELQQEEDARREKGLPAMTGRAREPLN